MFIHVTATVAKLLPLSLYLLIGFATVFQQLIQLPDEEVNYFIYTYIISTYIVIMVIS